jgi:hypothetical protein
MILNFAKANSVERMHAKKPFKILKIRKKENLI